jgi:mRNA-degrading endonuclease RelE of RelBE toxin-antitoxin system
VAAEGMTWEPVRSNRFKRRYHDKSPELRAKVDDAIELLCGSKDPRVHGRRKYGALEGCYGYNLDFRNRVLYALDFVKREIYFLRVCSHEEVYGS